jgi:hypothetical protein
MIWEELQGELDALQRDGLKRTPPDPRTPLRTASTG